MIKIIKTIKKLLTNVRYYVIIELAPFCGLQVLVKLLTNCLT